MRLNSQVLSNVDSSSQDFKNFILDNIDLKNGDIDKWLHKHNTIPIDFRRGNKIGVETSTLK